MKNKRAMNRYVIKFWACILMCFSFIFATAAPIDVQQAKQLARYFWMQKGLKSDVSFVDATPSQYSGFYILNTTENDGFVIVSSDDSAVGILAYSTEHAFNTENMPAVIHYWLGCYEDQVTIAKASETAPYTEMSRVRDSRFYNSVPPLISTTWDQGKYYNNYCPSDNSIHDQTLNGHACTGCTCTAMAQVMKFWNWPIHGSGSHSYTYADDPYYNWNYGTLSADFENTYYDWEHMPNELNNQSTATEIDAVATLMYHCGVASDASYNDDGYGSTGAFVSIEDLEGYDEYYCAEKGLVEFFRYKSSMLGISKDDYNNNVWIEMLKEDLSAGHPIIYQGYTGTGYYAYGHCFILDGYDEQNKFHVNWGWSGDYDGYFSLTALNPDGYYNYSYLQGALMHIEPDWGNTAIDDVTEQNNLNVYGENGNITILDAENEAIIVSDVLGRILYQQRVTTDFYQIPIHGKGLFIVKVGQFAKKVIVK